VQTVSEIRNAVEADLFVFPEGFSFFEPYLHYYIRQIIRIGGEAYVSRTTDGNISGVFIYDNSEKTGTVFTRSREAFDHFYKSKPFDSLFAEIRTEHECETYDIYTVNLSPVFDHAFRYEISVAEDDQMDDIERFMRMAHPEMNRRWVRVALNDGEKCFFVRLADEIAGLGWLSIVNGIGRFHSLYVKPRFRRIGIGEDLLYARLLWLKTKHTRSAFSEISRDNLESSKIAVKGRMSVSGQIFQYFSKDHEKTAQKVSVNV
jgi:ribosomal protein S18 acetylase RimI-like enzyme